MDKLRAMATFAEIVERGSLTAAANALDVSLPSVVRTLAALESAVGTRLANRTTRRFSLTDEGRDYYERCKRVLAEVDEAEAALSARRLRPQGVLRITAPVMFGRLHVAPVVGAFLAAQPEVSIELLLLDRKIDLVEEGVDLAVRIGALEDSTLVARPVGETHRVVCASPAYLRRAGVPKVPADLAAHQTIAFTGLGTRWMFSGRQRVAIRPVLVTNQVDAAIAACVDGLACGQFLSYQVDALLAAGRLKRVLADHAPPPLPIHVVYPQARQRSINVRAFVEFAVPRLVKAARPG